MKLVRAGLLVRADEGPSTTAVLGTHAVGNDGKILNGLKRRIDIDGARAKVIVVFRAVEHVRGAGLPGPAGSRRHIEPRAHLGRHKWEDIKNVSVDQCCMLDGGTVHLESEIGGRGLDERGLLGHFDDLGGLGQFQFDAERHDLTGLNNHSRSSDRREVGRFNLDGIRPWRHQRKAVGTIASGRRALRDIRPHVRDGHRRAWYNRASGICDRAGDYTLHALWPSNSTRSKNQESRKQDKKSSLPHTSPPEFMNLI